MSSEPAQTQPTTPRGQATTDLPPDFHGADTLAKARQQEKHWGDQDQKDTQIVKLHDQWQATQIRVFCYLLFVRFAL